MTMIPVEDMYPRPGARPVDEHLVADIAESIKLVGFLPSRAVEVRASGNRFVIVDGQHRVEAAKLAGLSEIPATVEETDDATALTYEGLLNLQRPDTPQERFSRLQDFFDLGDAIDPRQVAVATGVPVAVQESVQRVRSLVNDPTAIRDQGSLERILAIEEFADDPKAVERILHASEKDWQSEVRQLRMDRDRAKNMRAAIELAKGYDLINGEVPDDLAYLTRDNEKAPERATHVRFSHNEWSPNVDLHWYAPIGEADPAEARAAEAEGHRLAVLESAEGNRAAFICEYLAGYRPGATNTLRDYAVIAWESGIDAQSGWLDSEPWSDVHGFLARVYASVLAAEDRNAAIVLRYRDMWRREQNGAEVLAYYEALIDSGYVVTDVEGAELEKIRTAVEEAGL